jgi:hypothetical protein
MSLSTIAYQIATDPDFEAQILENPQQALSERGIAFSDLELRVIQEMQKSSNDRMLVPGDDPIIQIEWGIKTSFTNSN